MSRDTQFAYFENLNISRTKQDSEKLQTPFRQRVETTKREMFSQKSVRRFVDDSSAFVMGAMLLASARNRSISPPGISLLF